MSGARVETLRPDSATRLGQQPPVSPEQLELLAIHAEGRRKVAELVRQMTVLPEGPALRDLQVQVQKVKLDTDLQFLAALARQARARGDIDRALEAERAAASLRHPQPAAGPVSPATPAKPPEKGGQP